MKTAILAGFSLLIFLGSCSSRAQDQDKPNLEADSAGESVSQEELEKIAQEEAKNADKTKPFFDISGLGPQVVNFTTEQAAQELAKKQTVVYFFSATWCVECQETYKDLKANWKTIPGNFTLIYVDFDKAPELRKKYGVTIQHTFVVVGSGGERKKIWVGTVPIAEIVEIATRG